MINEQIWNSWNCARKLSMFKMLKFNCTHLLAKYIERMLPYGFVLISIAFDENVRHYVYCICAARLYNSWHVYTFSGNWDRQRDREMWFDIWCLVCSLRKVNEGAMPLRRIEKQLFRLFVQMWKTMDACHSFIMLYQLSIYMNSPCRAATAGCRCLFGRTQSQQMPKVRYHL